MADITLPAALRSLGMAGAASRALRDRSRKRTGDSRALLDELQNNLRYLDLVSEDGVPLAEVVGKLETARFDRLLAEGFDFNTIRRRKIASMPSLDGTELESWQGKETQELLYAIYAKLKDLKLKYPYVGTDRRYRWGVRVQNIRKRIWLLARHLEG